MARATTKADLTASANGQFDKMWKLIDSMSEEQQKAAFAEEMATAGKETHWSRDERKPFLPEPYNWKTYPAMNVGFWKKHQNTPLEEAKAKLRESHKDVMALIEQFSNDELFAKGTLAWTGTSPLGAYCVSTAASHYDWAMKKIKLHIKTSKG